MACPRKPQVFRSLWVDPAPRHQETEKQDTGVFLGTSLAVPHGIPSTDVLRVGEALGSAAAPSPSLQYPKLTLTSFPTSKLPISYQETSLCPSNTEQQKQKLPFPGFEIFLDST